MKYGKNDKFVIRGGKSLNGSITIQSSKNAVLPIMSACLLTKNTVKIKNVPEITDVFNMVKILKKFNVLVFRQKNNLIINPKNATNAKLDCKLIKSMRSSLFLLGSTLARFKTTSISMPGGCKIGSRPIDIHINAFKTLNVKVEEMGEYIFFDASNAKPNKIKLKIPSVGATENIIEFACLLKGKTTISNAAKEPEVVDLCNFLNKMGAKIKGAGKSKITIYGVDELTGCNYQPIDDRIVAGTIMSAVAICGGKVELKNANYKQNKKLIKILSKIGCKFKIKNDIITMSSNKTLQTIKKVATGYYPKFATDLQSLVTTIACLTPGKTEIEETVFENRFLIINGLEQMGANITKLSSNKIVVTGVNRLYPANLQAEDLRGGASLVLACLATEGCSTVYNVHYIDRGYQHIEEMFNSLGADIKRL